MTSIQNCRPFNWTLMDSNPNRKVTNLINPPWMLVNVIKAAENPVLSRLANLESKLIDFFVLWNV